jgi:GNAT superfamily N-acetyltransferase
LTVRQATLGDLSAVRDVYRRSSLSNSNDRAALLAHPDLLIWPADGITSGRTRVVTEESGAVIGFATVKDGGGGGLELEDLFVEPDRMRAGVGTMLITDAVDAASRSGRAWIDVTANPHAADFYTAVGFHAIGIEETMLGPAARLRLPVSSPERPIPARCTTGPTAAGPNTSAGV